MSLLIRIEKPLLVTDFLDRAWEYYADDEAVVATTGERYTSSSEMVFEKSNSIQSLRAPRQDIFYFQDLKLYCLISRS